MMIWSPEQPPQRVRRPIDWPLWISLTVWVGAIAWNLWELTR